MKKLLFFIDCLSAVHLSAMQESLQNLQLNNGSHKASSSSKPISLIQKRRGSLPTTSAEKIGHLTSAVSNLRATLQEQNGVLQKLLVQVDINNQKGALYKLSTTVQNQTNQFTQFRQYIRTKNDPCLKLAWLVTGAVISHGVWWGTRWASAQLGIPT